ncbi:hypothetical protein L7F22_041482 [Adiantum nelumboides]|nr:hypothetical protein [Adiantum nelumboides]
MATVRAIIVVVAAKGWILHPMDVKNAFLHGDLQEEVYMEQPPGYQDTSHSDYVYANHSLYVQKPDARIVIITIYVDDLIIGMKDLGELRYILGIEMIRNEGASKEATFGCRETYHESMEDSFASWALLALSLMTMVACSLIALAVRRRDKMIASLKATIREQESQLAAAVAQLQPAEEEAAAAAHQCQWRRTTPSSAEIEAAVPASVYPKRTRPFNCVICMEPLQDGQRVRRLRACRHTFHVSCIDGWFTNRSFSCPNCWISISDAEAAAASSPARWTLRPPADAVLTIDSQSYP